MLPAPCLPLGSHSCMDETISEARCHPEGVAQTLKDMVGRAKHPLTLVLGSGLSGAAQPCFPPQGWGCSGAHTQPVSTSPIPYAYASVDQLWPGGPASHPALQRDVCPVLCNRSLGISWDMGICAPVVSWLSLPGLFPGLQGPQ